MSKLREQYVVNEEGKRTGVILPLEEYERLMEDLHDLALVAERRQEASYTLNEIKQLLIGK